MSNESMKIAVDYPEAAATLKKVLGLKGSPVAIKFAPSKEEIPAGMEELDKTIRHCSMVNLARTEGKIFYATSAKHECNGGAWSLGLREITPTLKNGEFYFKLGKFDSAAACKRTIDKVSHLNPGDTYATLYAPLEKTPFTPQIGTDHRKPPDNAQTCAEFTLPARRANSCRILRHPVGLLGRNNPDLPDRTTELLARL